MPIQIDFLANTAKFLRGTKDAEGALEDVSSSLDDVARDSKKNADRMADGFTDAGKDIDRSNERLERSFSDLSRAAKSETQEGARAMSRNFEQGTSNAKRDLKQLGNEAKQNASETFSSFDGSAESFADGIQGTLGGIVSDLGPIGAIAGAAGAIGIGLIISAIGNADDANEDFKAGVADLGKELIKTGGIGETSLEYVIDKLQELATETDSGKDSLAKLRKIAEDADYDFRKLADSVGLNYKELYKLRDASVETADAIFEQLLAEQQSGNDSTLVKKYDDQIAAQDKITELYRSTGALAKEAAEQEAAYVAAGGPELELKAALIGNIDKAYDDAATATDDYINAESGIFDVTAYLEAMAAKTQALKDYQENLAAADLSPAAREYLNSLGIDAASSILAGYKKAAPDQKKKLNDVWTEFASDNSGTYKTSLETGLTSTNVKGPKVIPQAPDAGAIVRRLQNDLNGRSVRVNVQYNTPRPGDRSP